MPQSPLEIQRRPGRVETIRRPERRIEITDPDSEGRPRMMTRRLVLIPVVVTASSLAAYAQAPRRGQGEELEKHIAAQRRQIEDTTRPMVEREHIALELAATLDRAAQAAKTLEGRRSRWKE